MFREMLPNLITACRLIGTALMLPVPYSSPFLVLYTFCGITDILDGVVARATGKTSELGAKLDSIADLLFYAVMFLKIFPRLMEILSLKIWIFALSIVVLRIASYTVAAIKYRRFASLHTYMNKLTGVAVFLMPYFINTRVAVISCLIAGVIAALASFEELLMHIASKSYDPGVKSLIIRGDRAKKLSGKLEKKHST